MVWGGACGTDEESTVSFGWSGKLHCFRIFISTQHAVNIAGRAGRVSHLVNGLVAPECVPRSALASKRSSGFWNLDRDSDKPLLSFAGFYTLAWSLDPNYDCRGWIVYTFWQLDWIVSRITGIRFCNFCSHVTQCVEVVFCPRKSSVRSFGKKFPLGKQNWPFFP